MPNTFLRTLSAAGATLLAALLPFAVGAAPGDAVRQTVQTQAQINDSAARSQATVNQVADETQRLLEDYLTTKEQTDRLRIYNQQLMTLIRNQQDDVASINKQMKDIEVVEKEIIPLMIRMVDTLGQFVKLDVPFLLEERTNRVATLKEMMDRADVTISEKYRRVMEAYQIETDYGRSIEAYRGTLKAEDGTERAVDFLRVGRLVLAYQTLDREETGHWNKQAKKWEALDDSYRGSIAEGLRVARKQTAPDLINLPIIAPESKQ
jgi:hypothetical protein